MTQKSGIWRFSGVLRAIALVMAVLYALYFLLIVYLVLSGDTESIFYHVRVISTDPLKPWQLILGLAFLFVETVAFISICMASNQFLKTSKNEGFFVEPVITACRKLGHGLMLYWVGLVLTHNYMAGVLTINFTEDKRVPIEWDPLDFIVILIVGFILFLIARAMKEARDIDSDNKQII